MQQFKKLKVYNPHTGDLAYTFKQVNKNVVDEYALAESMQQSGSLTKGDALNACVSLSEEIAKAIANNGEVVIPHFGTFSLSTAGTGSAAKPEDISKADIKRSVLFTPSEEMLNIVRSAEIKIVKTATTDAETDAPSSGSTGTGGQVTPPSGGGNREGD